ncbi:translation initiation factor 2 [Pseudomonas aegrilactucae]|nr:translation initiation factor 2 [Pseudomonas aegrilactucae]
MLCVLGMCLVRPALAMPAAAPVLLAQSATQPAPARNKPSQPAAKPKAKPVTSKKTPARVAKSGRRKAAEVIAAPLPKARLDLSLPPDMVNELQPPSQLGAQVRRPLLPALFQDKPSSDSPFQLNGRLLSNEMQLQLRNDSRQDVEGAAIDFEFKQ